MLVISRGAGEAVMIGDDIVVWVDRVFDGVVAVRVTRSELRGRLTTTSFEGVLHTDESIDLGSGCRCQQTGTRGDRARMGFDVPKAMSIHRREVYEAIRREQNRRRGA